jgi:M6 family metalloprotease-like protein
MSRRPGKPLAGTASRPDQRLVGAPSKRVSVGHFSLLRYEVAFILSPMRRGLLLLFALFAGSATEAVPHIHRDAYPNAKPCRYIRKPSAAAIKHFGSPRAAVISNATSPKTIAVIVVRFPNAGSSTSGNATIQSAAHFDADFIGMTTYYQEVSFNTLDLTFNFFGSATANPTGALTAAAAGSYLMPHDMEYYGCGDVDAGCAGVASAPAGLGGAFLIRDALAEARVGRTLTLTTANYDAVLVMHAGTGNETTLQNGDIWSAFYQEDTIIGPAGGGFVDGAVFPELESSGVTSPLGVMCHEFGHVLTLPDLYNTAVFGGLSVVGNWDLMDSGAFLGDGANPGHMGAWCKTYLGWAQPQTLQAKGSFTINTISNASSPTSILKMPISGKPQEYFLVEYRSKTAGTYDREIPGTGVLVWHIDDAINDARGFTGGQGVSNTVNTGDPHYGISIVPADGAAINSSAQGSTTNLYPNGRSTFGHPQSAAFDNSATGIILANFQGVGSSAVSFDAANLPASAGVSIQKVVNYPNPAGAAKYDHPSGAGHTTIQFQLTKPANEYTINIYTLSGELVKKVPRDQITFQLLDRSTSEKFVYEYVWDLTNGQGDKIAPGVYLLLVRADGANKSSKAVIIR